MSELLNMDIALALALVLLAFRLVLYGFGARRFGIHSTRVTARFRCAYRGFRHPTN